MLELMVNTQDVVEIHDRIIHETGGHGGIVNYGNIDFAVQQANEAKDVHTKAARMLYGLIIDHGFVDGNKRTAYLSTSALLRENGMKFIVSDEEIWKMIHKIAVGKVKVPEIINWIKKSVGKL